MQIGYGHGGWVQIVGADLELPGPLYVRFQLSERGHPRITEVYLDGGGETLGRKVRDTLPSLLADIEALVLAEDREWVARSVRHAGPDLSLLASFFAHSFGRQAKDWVADSWRAQIKGSGVTRPKRPKIEYAEPAETTPLTPPENGLTDDFLRRVARRYYEGAAQGERPLLENMGLEALASKRTVQRWVYEARNRKLMDRGERGRVG